MGNLLFLPRMCFTPDINSSCMIRTDLAQFRFDPLSQVRILHQSFVKD